MLQGPDLANLTPVFDEDFEALLLGDLSGQNSWEDDLVLPSGVGPVQVVDDPTGMGQGQVASSMPSAMGVDGREPSAISPTPPTTWW